MQELVVVLLILAALARPTLALAERLRRGRAAKPERPVGCDRCGP